MYSPYNQRLYNRNNFSKYNIIQQKFEFPRAHPSLLAAKNFNKRYRNSKPGNSAIDAISIKGMMGLSAFS